YLRSSPESFFSRTGAGKNLLDLFVRARDDVNADELADAAGSGCAGIRGGLYRADIATAGDGDVSGADKFLACEHDVRRFDHSVSGFYRAHQPFRFNQAQGLHNFLQISMKSYGITVSVTGRFFRLPLRA